MTPDFIKGYVLAITVVISWGEDTRAKQLWNEHLGGYTREDLVNAGVDDYDIEVLIDANILTAA